MSREYPSSRVEPSRVIAVYKRIFAENGEAFLGTYAVAAVLLILMALSNAFTAWIVRDIVDEILYRQRTELIVIISLAIAAAFTIRGFSNYGQAVLLAKIGNNLVARYQKRVFEHLLRLDVGFYTQTRSGELAARINQSITGIRDLLSITLSAIARDIVALVGLVAVMVYMDPVLSAIALVMGPPMAYGINYVMRRFRSVARDQVLLNARLFGAFQETVQGIAVVKAFTMEKQLSDRIDALIDRVEERSNKLARLGERISPLSETLAGVVVAGIIAYGGYRAAYNIEPPGSMFAFMTALLLAYDPARRLARAQVGLERAIVNAQLIYELLDTVPRQRDRGKAARIDVARGEIRFHNVSFSYPNGEPVLKDISFTAKPGETTAVVGASGAGKSTLIALIEHFWDLDSGKITIDGQDISKVTHRSLRQSIAYVSQQPYLFEGTIRDNIRYGRSDATDEEIEEAARLAQCMEFIDAQPDGFATFVGENGVTLSGGQRQRLSIARAIVRNAQILLLDEATSALDSQSEIKVQQALEQVMKNRTTIVVAHRLSTIVNADKIIVLDNGKVVEEGDHDSLVSKPAGIYARFYQGNLSHGAGDFPVGNSGRKKISSGGVSE